MTIRKTIFTCICLASLLAGTAGAEPERFSRELIPMDEQEFDNTGRNAQGIEAYMRRTEPSEFAHVGTYLGFLASAANLAARDRDDAIANLIARGFSESNASIILNEIHDRAGDRNTGSSVPDTVKDLCLDFPTGWRNAPNLDQFAQKLANRRAQESRQVDIAAKQFLESLSEEGRAVFEEASQKLSSSAVAVEVDYSALLADQSGVVMPMFESTCNQAKEISE